MDFIEHLGLRLIPDSIHAFAGDLLDDSAIEDFANSIRGAAGVPVDEPVGNVIRAAERLGCLVLPATAGLSAAVEAAATQVGVDADDFVRAWIAWTPVARPDATILPFNRDRAGT